MNELYAEAGVKRQQTVGTILIKAGLIALAVLAFLLTFQSQILLILTTVLIVGIVYLFPRLNVEFEYVFCDGQLDFDKILGKAKRKNALKIDFEQVEIMAPMNSHSLDSYKNSNLTVKDFSSKGKDAKPYVIIYRKGETALKILFEPSEKMINCIKMKHPRKVAQY
ncbi:MAG: DUF6106 family protein [Anaerocolumna sp.]